MTGAALSGDDDVEPMVRIRVAASGEVVGRIDLPGGVDLRTVHLLCRLQLLARRAGGSIEVEPDDPLLRRLLDFAGLGDVVPGPD